MGRSARTRIVTKSSKRLGRRRRGETNKPSKASSSRWLPSRRSNDLSAGGATAKVKVKAKANARVVLPRRPRVPGKVATEKSAVPSVEERGAVPVWKRMQVLP